LVYAKPWQQAIIGALLFVIGVTLIALGKFVGVASAAVGVLAGLMVFGRWRARRAER
jgi:hypothetical protein